MATIVGFASLCVLVIHHVYIAGARGPDGSLDRVSGFVQEQACDIPHPFRLCGPLFWFTSAWKLVKDRGRLAVNGEGFSDKFFVPVPYARLLFIFVQP